MFALNEMMDRKIKILITGVTIVNENNINVFGGTHHYSEELAPIHMCNYLIYLPSEFVDDAF